MKNAKRILSGLLALVMVLALCPVIAFAEEPADVTINIATLENGTVTADKETYKVGDTVNLTVTPNSGYAQKLTVNGEALMLDWKTNTYSFVATETNYEIGGSFVPSLNTKPSDANRWDSANQAHGVMTTYYPANNDSWFMDFEGEYTAISVNAKNYWPVEQSYEGIANGGGFRIVLRMTLDNGKNYAFSIWLNTDKVYAYNHFGGGSSATGWSGAWCLTADKNAEATAALNGEGAEFKLERIDGNHMQITFGGTVLETYTIPGVTEANKIVSVGMQHNGNKGEYVAIPFELTAPNVEVNLPTDLEHGSITADKDNYQIGDTVTLNISRENGYFQKLFINGEPLMLDWKSSSYSFVATEPVYDITGSFVRSINHSASDWGRWDDYNQGHNILTAYYPNHNDAWWMTFNGEYQSVTVGVKNYLPIADTLDNFMVVLRVTMDNGNTYLFRVFTDKNGYYAYNRAGIQNPGDSSADWSHWKNLSHLNAVISGEGANFKVERTDANTLVLSINGEILDTYTMSGITADNKVASVSVKHQGNKGIKVSVPFYLQAVDAPDANITIADMANGTVTTDKDSYKVGDTVTLTIAANAGYAQKLYVNGNPVILGWKTNTYSFVAEANNEITGSFEPALDATASDANRFDAVNQGHGILNAYYPVNNDSWWMSFNGNYQSLTVGVKNYQSIANTLDNFMVVLRVTMDNGNTYLFRVFTDKNGYYAYNRAGIQNPGDSKADWGNWRNLSAYNDIISGAGANFKVERTAPNTLVLSVNGEILDTYTMNGITADNKITAIAVKHQGNQGDMVTIPFALELAPEHIHAPAEAVKENVVDATCTGAGSYDEVVYCAGCGEEISRVNITIAALGHTAAEAVKENEVAADCTTAGSYDSVVYCSGCNAEMSRETMAVEALGHNYVDGTCSVCGATSVLTDSKLVFSGSAGLSFQDYIGIQLMFQNSKAKNYDKYYVEITQITPEGPVTTISAGAPFPGYETTFTLFEQQIVSWSMTEQVTMTLYAEKDGVKYQGASITTTVEELALQKAAEYAGKDEARCRTMVDVLNYGAAVQVAFDHNAANLPNTKLGDLAQYGTQTQPEMTATNVITGSGAAKVAANNISLQDKVEFNFMVKDTTLASYTPKATLNGAEVAYQITSVGSGYSVVRVAIGAANMRSTYTFALYDADGNVASKVYNVSAEAYAKSLLTGTTGAAYVAMMQYGDSVASIK